MDLRSLRYFVAVAQTLNIGRAASNLHISQPPLTRQIQQLEADLGVTLFVRNSRGVTLTDAGILLLKESLNILSLIEQAADHARSAGQGRLGRIDVGIFGSGTLNLIPRIIADFRESNPDVSIVLHTMTRAEQIEALHQRRITVGFNRFVSPTADIVREVMLTEKMHVALHESDPLGLRDRVTISDLEQRPFVMFPTGSRPNFIDRVIDWCRDAGFTPHVSQEVGDAVTAVALVSAHLGICIVPQSTTIMQIPKIIYRPLTGGKNISVDLSCIYRKGDPSPILQAFLRSVRTTVNRQQEEEAMAP